jgi:hypothetical protein
LRRYLLIMALALIGPFTALHSENSIHAEYAKKKIAPGDTLCTQFSFFKEGGVFSDFVYRTTNYRLGILVPVNTSVRLIRRDDDSIELRLPDGSELKIQNIEEYSGETIDGIFNRTLRPQPVDLSVFTQEERGAIYAGEVEVGMTRAAVLIALGYPPKHKTPSLQGNQWRYWKSRTDTFLVIFEGDKVKAIKD